jgi:hypothetical protein
MRKTFEDMKIPLDVLHIPDIPTTTSKVSLAGIKKCSYPIIHSHKRQIFHLCIR